MVALALMKTHSRPTNSPNLIPGGPGHREGRVERIARRMLIAAGSTAVTTTAIMEIAYREKPWTHSRWFSARDAARRWAEPVIPKTRPLRWRLKDR
jgi:hypothetical protein